MGARAHDAIRASSNLALMCAKSKITLTFQLLFLLECLVMICVWGV